MTFLILNIISLLSTFIVAQLILFKFLDILFGNIGFLNVEFKYNLKLKHFVFFILTTIFLLTYTEFHLPYKMK